MIRIPVVTQEPVKTTSDVPISDYEVRDINATLVYNTIAYFGPPSGYYWYVDHVQLEFQADANVGNRTTYIYYRVKDKTTTRHPFGPIHVAGTIEYAIAAPGCSVWNGTIWRSFSCYPLITPVVQFPAAIGLYWTNFEGAGDVCTVHLHVREYRVV